MADYTVAANLITWLPAMHDLFGWPSGGNEVDLIEDMKPGDLIVPKFSQNPVFAGNADEQREIAKVFGDDYDARLAEYRGSVREGKGAVPFVMRVKRQAGKRDDMPSSLWSFAEIERLPLAHPFSTTEYLKSRWIPVEIGIQFKAMAAPGRRVQPLPAGAGDAFLQAGTEPNRGVEFLRSESLVLAATPDEAVELLNQAGISPRRLDRAFLVTDGDMPGLHTCNDDGQLTSVGEHIAFPPGELLDLFTEAKQRAVEKDHFKPMNAIGAAKELAAFLASGQPVKPVAEFGSFHDYFVLLPSRVTQAIPIAQRPEPHEPPVIDEPTDGGEHADDEGGEGIEQVELDKLLGLTVEAVSAKLPAGMALPHRVLAEAVTALRSGKHLLLSGPPGTGKSTIAGALCRAVVDSNYLVTTATADWTTFDTIGGYVPQPAGGLAFEPGVVLRSLKQSGWLVIDEMNRADIDKAFGPLFTLLAGSGGDAKDHVALPYRESGKPVQIGWAQTLTAATTPYALTPVWRLLGTMNVSDKASLFQLSFAFLRRFAVIDVPLPDEAQYRTLFAGHLGAPVPDAGRGEIIDAAIKIAYGPVQLGPAILLDIAAFTVRGLTVTSGGSAPYSDPVEAFLTAVRLYAVPQYEGTTSVDTAEFASLLRGIWPNPPAAAWNALEVGLEAVALA